MAPSPTATRTISNRGRGQRGRPRLKGRGNPMLGASRRRTEEASPRRSTAADGTPSGRRKPVYQNGYRPGGAGGGGRYIHPETGETIPAQVWKAMHGDTPRRRYRRDVEQHAPLRDVSPAAEPLRPNRPTANRMTIAYPLPSPSTVVHMPPPPADGVQKPREERSYTEFHPGFDIEQTLVVFSAQEVDGKNYRPPALPEVKSVKILDVKDEEGMRRTDNKPENGHMTTGYDDSRGENQAIFPTKSTGFDSQTASTPLDENSRPHNAIPGAPSGPGSVADGQTGPGITDPVLMINMTPSPVPSPLPIDPALAQISHSSQGQTETPAITPTDVYVDGFSEKTSVLPPTTPALDLLRKGRLVDDPLTLASRRGQRVNAGKKPRSLPPATSRRARAQKEQSGWEEERLNLPKPSFRPIQPFQFSEVAWSQGVGSAAVSEQMKGLGYQHTPCWSRPETLLRGRPDSGIDEELGSTEISDTVEYDMDEQDDKWLYLINSHRSVQRLAPITPEMFEVTMTKIEKEWVALEKRMPKVVAKPHGASNRRRSSGRAGEDEEDDDGSEDSKCAICDDGECENSNAIVFCDGCNLAVHQECYGVPYIPEGQWLCRRCLHIPRQTAHCVFCPNTDGAFKQTSTNRWAHLLCAIWIPEVRLANQAFMEPVDGIEMVPKSRWKLSCYICRQKMGACIQCSNKNCYLAFHVTCGRRARLHMKMKNSSGPGAQLESSGLKAYCDKHVPADWRRENYTDEAIMDAMDFYRTTMAGREWGDSQAAAMAFPTTPPDDDDMEMSKKVSHRVSHSFTPKRRRVIQSPNLVWKLPSGAPVIPRILFEKIVESVSEFNVASAEEYVADSCKYWTLKREARRGASLLKRLQLQMDSFTSVEVTRKNYGSMGRTRGGAQLENRREFAESLERDLRNLSNVVKEVNQREIAKISDAEKYRDEIDRMFFPEVRLIRETLDKAQSLDCDNTYELGFGLIRDRLEHRLYTTVAAFCTDLRSVLQSSPTEPRLDHVIGIDHTPPLLFRTSLRDHRGNIGFGSDLLRKLQPSLDDAVKHDAMLRYVAEERPPKKRRLTKEVNGAHATGVINGENRPNSPSDQLAKEDPSINTFDSQRALSPAVPETIIGSVSATVNKTILIGLWDQEVERGVARSFYPRPLAVDKASKHTLFGRDIAPSPSDRYESPTSYDTVTTTEVAKLPDVKASMPVEPLPQQSRATPSLDIQMTNNRESELDVNRKTPPSLLDGDAGGEDDEMKDAPGEEVEEEAIDEDAPGEVDEDMRDVPNGEVYEDMRDAPGEDIEEDEDAPGEEIDEEEEALSIARATSTVPTTPAAASVTPASFNAPMPAQVPLASTLLSPALPAPVLDEEMELYDQDAEGEPDDDDTLIPLQAIESVFSIAAEPACSSTENDPGFTPIEQVIPRPPVLQAITSKSAFIMPRTSELMVEQSLEDLMGLGHMVPKPPADDTPQVDELQIKKNSELAFNPPAPEPPQGIITQGFTDPQIEESLIQNPDEPLIETLASLPAAFETSAHKPAMSEPPIDSIAVIPAKQKHSPELKHLPNASPPTADPPIAGSTSIYIRELTGSNSESPSGAGATEPITEEFVEPTFEEGLESTTEQDGNFGYTESSGENLTELIADQPVVELSPEKFTYRTTASAERATEPYSDEAVEPAADGMYETNQKSAETDINDIAEPSASDVESPTEANTKGRRRGRGRGRTNTSRGGRGRGGVRSGPRTGREASSVGDASEPSVRANSTRAVSSRAGSSRAGSEKNSYKKSATPRGDARKASHTVPRMRPLPPENLVIDPPTRLPEVDAGDAGDDLLAGYRPEDLPSPMEIAFPPDADDDGDSLHSYDETQDLILPDTVDNLEERAAELLDHNLEIMTEDSVLSDPPSTDGEDFEQRLSREGAATKETTPPASVLSEHGGNNVNVGDDKESGKPTEEEPTTPKGGRGARMTRQTNGRFGRTPTTTPGRRRGARRSSRA